MNIAIIGASGGIGKAVVRHYLDQDDVARVYAFSRSGTEFDDDRV